MSSVQGLVVGGENLIDHVTREGDVEAHPGGSPFNVAMALGRLGAHVTYISPISTDHWGDELAAHLTQSGVALTGGRHPAPTTMSRVEVTGGVPEYSFERDATAERQVTVDSLARAVPPGTSVIHTGSLALTDGPDAETWEVFCAKAADDGMILSLDPNVRISVIKDVDGYRDRILRMAARSHIVKLSDEDLGDLYPHMDEAAALAKIREAAPDALVVLTKGARGAAAWLGETGIDLEAPRVEALADTVGAGDTFMAALLSGLSRERLLGPGGLGDMDAGMLSALVHRALMAAALNCARHGCDPPTAAELDAAMTSGGRALA